MTKRASMREGPLADLFRSTESSVAEEEVKITDNTAAASSSAGEDAAVAVAEAVEAVEVVEVETVAETVTPEAPVTEPEAPVDDPVETEDEPAEEPVEAAEPKVIEVDSPNHEGLQALLSGAPADASPAYGRKEPDTITFDAIPRSHQAVLRVVGVGGAGVNAVNRMVEAQVPGVEFVAINTDLQSLQNSKADVTLHIGSELTRGLGSGSDPRVGYRAAFQDQDKIKSLLAGSDMVFIAAGAGGGTGTGAAPMVAKLARDVGALTVAAVTKPFSFEGALREKQAEEGIAALSTEVDTMIVVPNERLLEILERRTSIQDAFRVADDVLRQSVQGISDLVMLPGLINLDFADVRTTMLEAGDAILGIGMGIGEHRAILAAQKAVSSPLLDSSVDGAHSLLLSITGGSDLSLIEASEAAEVVREAAHPDANIIFGASIDEDLSEEVWVTVIATRFDKNPIRRRRHDADGPREPSPQGGRGRDFDPQRRPLADWEKRWAAEDHYSADRGSRTPRQADTRGMFVDVPEFTPGQ